MTTPLPVFLSAYDPAELPGGTVDPLGFTAGYLALADALFPGMTAAAAQATYFPMLCAGLSIAENHGTLSGLTAAAARKRRIDVAMRFERLWALACALQEEDDTGSKVAGLRGIRYVERERQRLQQAHAGETSTEFPLLAVQYRYGAFGIYGGVAEQLHLLDKSTFALTSGFGDVIGQGFLDSTTGATERREIARAAVNPKATIRLSTLKSWGTRAHAGAPLRGPARTLLAEAVVQHQERAGMLALLEGVTSGWTGAWTDRALLDACSAATSPTAEPKLSAALQATLAYDGFLRCFTLLFERVLWLCRHNVNSAEEVAAVLADDVIRDACAALPERASALLVTSDQLSAAGNRDLHLRGRGIMEVAQRAAAGNDVASTVRAVLARHSKIQRGKLELGRPKLPWLEERGSTFAVTSARVGDRNTEPRKSEDVRAPDWRFAAALSFLSVLGGIRGEQRATG